jgi:hypothetical protein
VVANQITMQTIQQLIDKHKVQVLPQGAEDWEIVCREVAKEYAKQECIQFLNDIRDYEHENGQAITYDERDSEELYEVHLQHKPEE